MGILSDTYEALYGAGEEDLVKTASAELGFDFEGMLELGILEGDDFEKIAHLDEMGVLDAVEDEYDLAATLDELDQLIAEEMETQAGLGEYASRAMGAIGRAGRAVGRGGRAVASPRSRMSAALAAQKPRYTGRFPSKSQMPKSRLRALASKGGPWPTAAAAGGVGAIGGGAAMGGRRRRKR